MATEALGIPSVLSHYKILEKIGEGGMGAVFRAHDERLDREVAIKVLPAEMLADEAARRRFRREALALSKLNHPNIATIHDFDTDKDVDFLVMEYITGTTLSDEVAKGPLPPDEVLRIGSQMLEGLAAAHSRGLIHRDLKPGNVRVTPEGRVKILDFGLAKVRRVEASDATASLTSSRGISGTLPYMAPEQVLGEECDERTDIYSAGAVLYELATGRNVFPEAKSGRLVDAILHEQPKPPRAVAPEIPAELESIILKALSHDAGERYQKADEFLSAVRQLTGEAPVRFRSTMRTRLRPITRVLARHRNAAVAAGVLAVLVVAALFFFRSPALAFNARDFVVVSDFDNQTGDFVFDKSLSTAFNTSLGQSAYANIVSRQRLEGALKRMKRPAAVKIDEATAREIAQREGLNVLVVPSITAIGDTYSLSARIHDVQNARDFRSEVVTAKGKNEVLPALDRLVARIRKDLGESAQAISQTSRPLALVSTSSLEALRQFSIGIERRIAGNMEEARTYFENALRIDPNFVSARASLGALLIDAASFGMPGFDATEGKRLLDESAQSVSGLTDRERYGILAFRESKVNHNPDGAISNYKALLALYPDDVPSHNNLCWEYSQTGRFTEAIAEARTVMRLDPTFVITQLNLAHIYLYQLLDVPAAMEVFKSIQNVDSENPWLYDGIGWAAIARGDLATAQQNYEKAVQLNPRQLLVRYRLAHTYRMQGNYAKAYEALEGLRKQFPTEISALYDEAVNLEGMKQHAEAMRTLQQFRRLSEEKARKNKEPLDRLGMAAAMARMGQTKEAAAMLESAKGAAGSAVDIAGVLTLLGKKDEAVTVLQSAIKGGFNNLIWLKMHPDLEALRGYPGFEELFKGRIKT